MVISCNSISGYQINELLYDGSRTVVYRGHREVDQKPVVIKLLKNPYPSFTELVQFRNQYTIAKNLEVPGIIRPYCLLPYQNAYALMMEDFGGISLRQYIRTQPLKLGQFLQVALELIAIVEGLYRARVIHKDIKPANILIHPDSKRVKLIDFSIASLLPRESQEIASPTVLEGTLAYLSPEQTGRMNRGIDYRTDFYSLGVTFYELLTGRLPFQVEDPMELVHCHIAKYPATVHDLNPTIPPVLSRIVQKLVAKNAEDRYQSVLGLRYDLECCWEQLKNGGRIDIFKIGQRDISDRFIIPEKLYGREQEVQTLLNAFERVSLGATELMLVAGFSGIGKTAIVNEVHKPMVRQRGYFIKGKFDQLKRNQPLSAFIQAFRDLMGQLLTESDEQLAQWKTKILEALGENGQVIIEVVPELERLIGPQPEVPKLSGSAAQNRFNLLFEKFMQVFTSPDHPLVIFVDDLQWADSASLKLMQLLLSEAKASYLLLIGAYRDSEVFSAHPLMLTLEQLQKGQVIINTIALTPLREIHLNQLIADTLSCTVEIALPLTQLVYQKTQGNPFFSTQFLKALHGDGLITFNCECGYWQCDMVQVMAKVLTNDVVEFMALQLQKLPNATQRVLQLAACLGNQFDLATVATVHEKSQVETAANLWRALQEGLLLPTSEVYKFYQDEEGLATEQSCESPIYRFLHDRVQQAAYSLIPTEQRQSTHLKIGQLLLNNISQAEREERVFEIVNQLNIGVALITQQTKRQELARLNLFAGRKAKAATAYAAAIEYLKLGMELLPFDCWQSQYDLTLNFYQEVAEAEYLNGHFETSEQLADSSLKFAKTVLDKVKFYEIKIQSCAVQNCMIEALEIGIQALKLLGVFLPSKPTMIHVWLGFTRTKFMLRKKRIEDLANLPEMTDLNKLAALQILMSVAPAASQANSLLYPLIILTSVQLSLQHGNSSVATYAYGCYGLILCSKLGDIEVGYRFGRLALFLLEQFNVRELKGKIYFLFYAAIQHWKEPVQETVTPLLEAIQSALESGDLGYVNYCNRMYCNNLFLTSEHLSDVDEKLAQQAELMQKLQLQVSISFTNTVRQAILNLLGQSECKCLLIGELFNESEVMQKLGSNFFFCSFVYHYKTLLMYLFKDYSGAIENAKLIADSKENMPGFMHFAVNVFYYSLALLAHYPQVSKREQKQYLKQVDANQKKMRQWAHYCPENFQNKYELVVAEKARILGQEAIAMSYYERAIATAKAQRYIQEEALASELAAEFHLAHGRAKIAQTYLTDAYYGYARWGAKAITDDLATRHPQLLQPILQPQQLTLNSLETITPLTISQRTIHPPTQISTSHSTNTSEALDFASILKASQCLSGEIHLDKLLITLLNIVITNAGASKCVLLLLWDEKLRVEAIAQLGQAPTILPALSLDSTSDIPVSLIYTVKRTLQPIVISDATQDASLVGDAYICQQQPKSLLCTPILHQGKLLGILYLENTLTTGAFTSTRVAVLNLLCTQAAISLENARLYQQSQTYVQKLEQSLQALQQTQTQLVQSEKMSALGNLVAGVAHEVNNPIGFIKGSLTNVADYVNDLHQLVQCVQQQPLAPAVADCAQAIDLEFLLDDLPKLIAAMQAATQRIQDISHSLRTFSRADTSEKVLCQLQEGIDSTLLILKYRLKANERRPFIEVVKSYSNLPLIKCFFGQINQVFMNILANAIDAIDEECQKSTFAELAAQPKRITIQTEVAPTENLALIRIADNAPGMSQTVKAQVFDYLFTTKSVGKGTGLGLAIARQIVEDTHGGQLTCHSTLGVGTEFVIALPLG